MVFFLLMSQTLAAASSFSSGRAYPSLSFLFLFMLPLFALRRRIAEPISFLPPFFPSPQISLFERLQLPSPHLGLKKVLPTSVGKKHSIGSPPLTSSPLMTLTYLLFFIAPLTFPLLFSLLPYFAPGRCFRTWVLITYKFY